MDLYLDLLAKAVCENDFSALKDFVKDNGVPSRTEENLGEVPSLFTKIATYYCEDERFAKKQANLVRSIMNKLYRLRQDDPKKVLADEIREVLTDELLLEIEKLEVTKRRREFTGGQRIKDLAIWRDGYHHPDFEKRAKQEMFNKKNAPVKIESLEEDYLD